MRALVGCEESGKVRSRLRAMGIDAWSCDLLPARDGSAFHVKAPLETVVNLPWDFGIFFPPCTHLSVSGARHFAAKRADGRQQAALDFVGMILALPFPLALENPVSIISSHFRKPDQIIQPWMFGHGETKTTCLWLQGLPKLVPTNVVEGRAPRIHRMAPGPNRARDRSETYDGIAAAMAEQWGGFMLSQERKAA